MKIFQIFENIFKYLKTSQVSLCRVPAGAFFSPKVRSYDFSWQNLCFLVLLLKTDGFVCFYEGRDPFRALPMCENPGNLLCFGAIWNSPADPDYPSKVTFRPAARSLPSPRKVARMMGVKQTPSNYIIWFCWCCY